VEEKFNLQPVDIDIKISFLNEPIGCQSDQLSQVLCYSMVVERITEKLKNRSFNLRHSRKSFLNLLSKRPTSERDLETIGISHHLCKQGVDYLRVHNVEAHQRSLTASASLGGLYEF